LFDIFRENNDFILSNSIGGIISSTLLKANVTILNNTICSSQYGTTFIGADMLCAAAPGKDTCQVSLLF
jgi:hypothetical protein